MKRYLGYWNDGYQDGEHTKILTEKQLYEERDAWELGSSDGKEWFHDMMHNMKVGEIKYYWGVLDWMFVVRIEDSYCDSCLNRFIGDFTICGECEKTVIDKGGV